MGAINWKNLEIVQDRINNDSQLNREQKLDRLLFMILSDDVDNWLPIGS
jgi:hypothetical protein